MSIMSHTGTNLSLANCSSSGRRNLASLIVQDFVDGLVAIKPVELLGGAVVHLFLCPFS
jgi:hypothetical protein